MSETTLDLDMIAGDAATLRRIASYLDGVDWQGGAWGQSAVEDAAATLDTLVAEVRRLHAELEAADLRARIARCEGQIAGVEEMRDAALRHLSAPEART